MKEIRNFLTNLIPSVKNEKGQTVIEYILVIVLIALVLVFAFTRGGVETGVETASQNIAAEITNVPAP